MKNLDSILRVTSDGSSTTFASGEFQANSLAFDADGNLFAGLNAFTSDEAGVMKFTPDGTETTFAFGPLLPSALAFEVPEIAQGRYDKIIVVIGENVGYEPLLDQNNCLYQYAPYVHGALKNVALNYTDAHSSIHPSLPNYLRIFAGDNYCVDSDGCVCGTGGGTCGSGNGNDCQGAPETCSGGAHWSPISQPTLHTRLKNDPAANNTDFVLYAEGLIDMNSGDYFACGNADYAQKHNPAAFFAGSRTDEHCTGDVWKSFPKDSPPPAPQDLFALGRNGVAFIIPGQDHNGHDPGGACTHTACGTPNNCNVERVMAWNDWLANNMPAYVAYARDQANNTLLIITQDEESKDKDFIGGQVDPNHIMLFLIAGNLQPQTDAVKVGDPSNPSLAAQYNILRTITKNFGVADLGNATGPSIKVLIPPIQPPP